MNKKDREKIFNKYGGHCAYCGCELQKGWHVDEIEPVRRNYKWVEGAWSNGGTIHMTEDELIALRSKWTPGKWVCSGELHPERFHIDNQNPACASCNINKHSESLESFRQMIKHFITTLNRDSTQYKIAKRYGLIQETGIEVKFYFETVTPTKP